MVSEKELFIEISNDNISGVAYKVITLKKRIMSHFARSGDCTIADLCRETNASIPTITKLLGELIEDGFVLDYGKVETGGGRKPNLYGLNASSVLFMGVEVKRQSLNIALLDFKENIVCTREKIPFVLANTTESFDELCTKINDFVYEANVNKRKIFGVVINISGRVNTTTGYSYSYYPFEGEPLSKLIESKVGIKTYLENDTRAMAYGEFAGGVVKDERNVLFINVSRGIGLGIMIDGKLYYGNSGFSGEFGHIPFYNNDTICHCGKRGCLETEASGSALERTVEQLISAGKSSILSSKFQKGDKIRLEDIVQAALQEDVLAIEQIEKVGEKLGRAVAMLINLFNPELVIVGGTLSAVGEYIMLPIRSAINKYSLTLVSKDTSIKASKLGDKAGAIGACLLVRLRLLETL